MKHHTRGIIIPVPSRASFFILLALLLAFIFTGCGEARACIVYGTDGKGHAIFPQRMTGEARAEPDALVQCHADKDGNLVGYCTSGEKEKPQTLQDVLGPREPVRNPDGCSMGPKSTFTCTPSPTYMLYTRSRGGTVSLNKGLSKEECEKAMDKSVTPYQRDKSVLEPPRLPISGDIEDAQCFELKE